MATSSSRARASTATYSESEGAALKQQLDILRLVPETQNQGPIAEDIGLKIEAISSVRQFIVNNATPNRIRDAFRHQEGFQLCLNVLRNSTKLFATSNERAEDFQLSLDVSMSVLGLLSTALEDHWGNRKYFRKRVEHGGWVTLEDVLSQLLDTWTSGDVDIAAAQNRLFGALFACAIEGGSVSELFEKLEKHLCRKQGTDHPPNDDSLLTADRGDYKVIEDEDALHIMKASWDSLSLFHNPEAVLVALQLWRRIGRRPKAGQALKYGNTCLLEVTKYVVELSTHNLLALHSSGILRVVLDAFVDASLNLDDRLLFRDLAMSLLKIGINELNDAHFLYSRAAYLPEVAELLRVALKQSNTPPFIHFDLSLNGASSIELPDMRHPFPPISGGGYTLSIWLQIVRFDPESHTTIFGAFDSSQACFVLVYLEKDTHNLILQTSVTSPRPSVRFKSFVFEERRWYHLCLVHKRPKTTSSSRASLFIDGEFVEQVKAQYPANAPPAGPSTDMSGILSPGRKFRPVQAFLGTPRDLASKFGKGLVMSQWRLALIHLFNDVLSDDLIAVHKQLGPRYHGNYQDCLGSFQTYEASAALNLRNENLHPGKEEKSDIVTAIRSKASAILPEAKVLLNFSPISVIFDEEQSVLSDAQLMKSLSKAAVKNLRNLTRGGRTVVAVNGAVPSINEALIQPRGLAVLTGDPAVAVPQSLDDAAWRVGGCASVGLALVEAAQSRQAIIRALNILFAIVKDNWRNSEAMERENGFGVLASLLTEKLEGGHFDSGTPSRQTSVHSEEDYELFALEVLSTVLEFTGYQKDSPTDSVINNPLAYRILIVDLDMWRRLPPPVQRLYFEQFLTFGVGSKHRNFNAKRLARMRIAKKWLEALKGDVFYPETFSYMIKAFQSLLGATLSTESLRSLALYITFAVHRPKRNEPRPLRSTKSLRKPRQFLYRPTRSSTTPFTSSGPTQDGNGIPRTMTRLEIGIKILGMYTDLLCGKDATNIKKFARTVTNKWLLHLLADDDPSVVVLSMKILAHVLIVNGSSYVEKFAERTGGFVIMKHRLKRWWNLTTLWRICFAILFGRDVTTINFARPFDLYSLVETFAPVETVHVVYPRMLQVIVAMLRNGLKSITKHQHDPDSPQEKRPNGHVSTKETATSSEDHNRKRSMSLQNEVDLMQAQKFPAERLDESARTIQTVTQFLADMHSNAQAFRDFTISTPYVQELLFLLFPIIVSSDVISPETELNSRDSSLTFSGRDVVIRPLSQNSMRTPPIVRTAAVEVSASSQTLKAPPLKRGSSYILVTSEQSPYRQSSAKLQPIILPKDKSRSTLTASSSLIEEVLELVIAVFSDQILARKDFPGIGLFMKVPAGFQEHQAYFESFILRNTVSSLENTIRLDQKLLWEPRVLTNLARFATHLGEAVYEGWFIDGAEVVVDFLGRLLEHLQRPDIQQMKSVRLCSEIISSMRTVVCRIILLRLSESSDSQTEPNTVAVLKKITYWQTILLNSGAAQEEFLKLLCYLLYTKLMSPDQLVRDAAVDLWRTLLVQSADEASGALYRLINVDHRHLARGFEKILELDNATFLDWIDDHRVDLDAVFLGDLAILWEEFVTRENRKTEASARARILKRQEKLKSWIAEDVMREDIIRRHEVSSDHWRSNIYASEQSKLYRSNQDQQDGLNFDRSCWKTMKEHLKRPGGLFDDHAQLKWQLDQTEGRNRMRLRMMPDKNAHLYHYHAKSSSSRALRSRGASLSIQENTSTRLKSPLATSPVRDSVEPSDLPHSPSILLGAPTDLTQKAETDDGFEIVDDPSESGDSFEDKNRKVMRSLQRGDQVEHVHNMSRIIGLEACEGLLIVGKNALYLLDNFFQRSDGEIVDVWNAPQEERDSYMQMISGREVGERNDRPSNVTHETRFWVWRDVLSICKRRFLFRDVAIEAFFVDGRSYLLTVASPKLRDELYQKLLAKAQTPSLTSPGANPEDLWRMESLRTPEDNPQTFGSRLTSVFASGLSGPATKRWIKGEISNFHYLMLINTMAGRTFNDLTQYPVFPWVLADHTSEELDLTNSKSFRDLTKPMGCQNPERQAEFRERYQSFAEMGDQNSPPFHYGTHYSSAMIVTSYLIRLQPFVQSYLLLQGGSFDHPDRLFYSIEKAWTSASRDNMSDVRELIPEFYYLPELLSNGNGYDFGSRQGQGGTIDNVELPPWAKGDPKIFIAKNREALESDYVSKNLHQWIDLIFGHKQRGEAALEATNVFHHLSYRGARNLDEINDPVERLATIGIIHNFGQTPHQVFQRAHPQREDPKHRIKRLDSLANTLTRLPFPLLESRDRIDSLTYSTKQDKLLCSGAFRLNMPPAYDKHMEWGFIDGSVRFYSADGNRLIGLFEHIHQGQLSCVRFADSRTLITAGMDCTISIWQVTILAKAIDLTPRGCLFGHRTPVTTISISRSFSCLLSASSDGGVLLWDLNRLELIRKVAEGKTVACTKINDVTGTIMLCRGSEIALFTLNGEILLEQHICVEGDDMITSCAFYEGSGNEFLERNLIFTGHKRGVVNIWNLAIHDGRFALEHIKRMNHMDSAGFNIGAAISCILPMPQTVYTGDDDGRVYEWDCIQRQDGHL